MSLMHPAARRLFAPLALACAVRPAREADRAAIARLMAPHIASGVLLPREAEPADFLVAEVQGELLGCVALSAWTADVVELGSLVSNQRGLGRLLVEAAVYAASAAGFRSVVALSSTLGFFRACGFQQDAVAPWAQARGLAQGGADVRAKAERCALCPRLGGCSQALLRRALPAGRPSRLGLLSPEAAEAVGP